MKVRRSAGEPQNAQAAEHAAWLRRSLKALGGEASWTWPLSAVPPDASAAPLHQHLRDAHLSLPDGARITLAEIPNSSGGVIRYTLIPPQPRAWVVLLHGYLLHTLCQASFISFLLQQGYAVLAFDWPGHGLSQGRRATIDCFGRYAAVLESVMRSTASQFGSPPHLIAHSTGASAWLEYQRTRSPDPFGQVVLVAPLLRSAVWHLSALGVKLASPWVASVPRCFRKSSSDPDFLRRMRSDPLAPRSLPLEWSHAQIRWVADFADAPVSERSIWVMQGDQDRIVDWRFGIRRIEATFPHAHIHLWPGQQHDLLNEGQPAREQLFRHILSILDGVEPVCPT